MKKVLLIALLQSLTIGIICAQSFNINDLIKLSYLPTKEIDRYLYKKGFDLSSTKTDSLSTEAIFTTRIKKGRAENFMPSKRDIYISMADSYREYNLKISLVNEYVDGQRELIKSGFFYDESADVNKDSSMLFQKGNIVILASSQKNDAASQYTFKLKVKKIPERIKYAEDLLQFDSH